MPLISQARIQAFTGDISFEPEPPPTGVVPTGASGSAVSGAIAQDTGPTGPTGPQGDRGPTGPLRADVTMEIQWTSGSVVTDDTVYFIFNPLYGGTINSLTYFTTTGSYTVAIKIGVGNVGNLSVVSVDSESPTTLIASSPNTFSPGQAISAVVTNATANPSDTVLSLSVTWS